MLRDLPYRRVRIESASDNILTWHSDARNHFNQLNFLFRQEKIVVSITYLNVKKSTYDNFPTSRKV